MTGTFLAVHQVSRPHGRPTAEHFAFVKDTIPILAPGTALAENLYLSVDPYMLRAMDGNWQLHAPLEGRSIGRIVDSRDQELAVGDVVFHYQGWRTHAIVSAANVRILPQVPQVPLSAYLSILGGTGLTAYVGLTRIARLQAGESVFISAASGGVGNAAGQIAGMLGASQVIGSTGSAAKVKHLVEDLSFDAAFDYHEGPVHELLAQAAPGGIDVYFDNVGGEQLEAALSVLHDHGRIAWCGLMAEHNSSEPLAIPRNLSEIVRKNLRLEGFSVRNYLHLQDELEAFLVPHIQAGRVVIDQTIVKGFEHIVEAFLGMLYGEKRGKMIIQVSM
jgi:NADPH-dependent curcumin reductase CurA